MGHGIDDIPGSIVSVDTAPSQSKPKDYVAVRNTPPNPFESPVKARTKMNGNVGQKVIEVETITQNVGNVTKIPKVIFVIGGPGSNKATLCLKAVGMNPGWSHIRYVSQIFQNEYFIKYCLVTASGELCVLLLNQNQDH